MATAALIDYIDRYVAVNFPYADLERSVISDVLPTTCTLPSDFHHAVCSVRDGGDNRCVINVGVTDNNCRIRPLAKIMSYASPATNLAVADAIALLVDRLYYAHTLPLIVDFASHLPGKLSALVGRHITIHHSDLVIAVMLDNERIAVYDFQYEYGGAQAAISHHVQDWHWLAKHLGMTSSNDAVSVIRLINERESPLIQSNHNTLNSSEADRYYANP